MNPGKSSRETILKKIKKALATYKTPLQEPDFSSPVFAVSAETDLSVVFAESFLRSKGEFFFCESEKEFLKSISLFVHKRELKNIFVWEERLIKLMTKAKAPIVTSQSGFEDAEAGITSCERLIARTGSLIVSSATLSGRRLGIYPPIHIVVAYTSQVSADIKDGLAFVKEKYKEKGMPSMVGLVTGPSRTSDIEKTLVMGAHGPKELILFLIDDSAN